MKLLNGYILIRVEDPISKTDSGILIAEQAKRLPSRGTVEAVAPGITDVTVGDKVEFLRYASLDGTDPDTRLCKLEHVIGIYES